MVGFKRHRHAQYNLKYNLVVTTKNSVKCISWSLLKDLKAIIKRIFADKNCEVFDIKGGKNYINIYFETPPNVQLSILVNNFKTVSSRLIRKKYKEYFEAIEFTDGFWSQDYLITSSDKKENIKEFIKSI